MADMAGDYTKRKHVVRVTSIAGAELLLQAGGASEAAKWLQAFRSQVCLFRLYDITLILILII